MKEKARSDREVCISIGKIEGEAQVTSNDTGWSEEEKERMRQAIKPHRAGRRMWAACLRKKSTRTKNPIAI